LSETKYSKWFHKKSESLKQVKTFLYLNVELTSPIGDEFKIPLSCSSFINKLNYKKMEKKR